MTDTQALIDPLVESTLFDIEAPPPVSLADKFGVPPFSVLDRRSGEWQSRKRQWGQLGIQSEIGRDSIVNRLNIGDNGLARRRPLVG